MEQEASGKVSILDLLAAVAEYSHTPVDRLLKMPTSFFMGCLRRIDKRNKEMERERKKFEDRHNRSGISRRETGF